MTPTSRSGAAPPVTLVAITYLLISGAGIWALPALFAPSARQTASSSPLPVSAVLWLLAAALLLVVSLAMAPALDRVVRAAVTRSPWFRTDGPHAIPAATVGWISFPVTATIVVALGETIARPAIVAALGGPVFAGGADAGIAVGCLIILLLLLMRLNLAARLWVEAGAWFTLDALMATSNSEGARRFYDTSQHRTRAVITQRGDRAGDEVTQPAPGEAPTIFAGKAETVFAGQATVVAPTSDTAATVSIIEAESNKTILAERPTDRGDR